LSKFLEACSFLLQASFLFFIKKYIIIYIEIIENRGIFFMKWTELISKDALIKAKHLEAAA